MPKYIKTLSFRSQQLFDPNKDDPAVNRAMDEIRSQGGTIENVKLSSCANLGAFINTFMVTYEAESPVEIEIQRDMGSMWVIVAILLGLAVLGLLAMLFQIGGM